MLTSRIKAILNDIVADCDIRRDRIPRGFNILTMSCFWVKRNFSAIVRYSGREYYCWHNGTDFVVELN
jgi:predicted nucleotidyltransferase